MIGEQELQTLVEFADGPVLSVYLDTDLSDKSKEAVKLMFRSLVRDLQADSDQEMPADEIRAVQRWLDFEYDWQSRGVAIFAAEDALWKVIPLPIAVSSRVFWAEQPYLRLLTDIQDRFGEYTVALVDRQTLRLFAVAWGGIRSVTEAAGEELKRHKQGGYAAARYQRHEDNLALHNLKAAVETVQTYCQRSGCHRLMLGGSPEVIAQFRDLLPHPLREQVIGEFPADMDASLNEVLHRSLDILQQVNAEEERELVAQAITAAAKGSNGVTGLADTLYMLHQGRVRVLLVGEHYRAPGFVCSSCGYVAVQQEGACSFCQGDKMVESQDVVNLAIHKALETGADVNIVRDSEELEQAGGIAAILRY
jgi:peptide chain release factor subunit 1